MMALGRWPFSPAEIRAMLETPLTWQLYAASDMFWPSEPWPHLVYYHNGRVTHVDPKNFLWTDGRNGPSDSVWIVPGTAQGRLA